MDVTPCPLKKVDKILSIPRVWCGHSRRWKNPLHSWSAMWLLKKTLQWEHDTWLLSPKGDKFLPCCPSYRICAYWLCKVNGKYAPTHGIFYSPKSYDT